MKQPYERLIRNFCIRITCISKEVETLVGSNKAFEVIKKGNEKGLLIIANEDEARGRRSIKDFKDVKNLLKEDLKSPFISNIVTGEVLEETTKKIAFQITKCLWAEAFRNIEASEFGYNICCEPDFSLAQNLHQNICLKRTKTLMQGDQYCNHTYFWKE